MAYSCKELSQVYDSIYSRKLQKTVLNEIDGEIVGRAVASLRASGIISNRELKLFESAIRKYLPIGIIQADRGLFVDFGCGFGILGRRLSKSAGLRYAGFDCSKVAIRYAATAARNDKDSQSLFWVSDFISTGLSEKSVGVAFSLDALYLASNPSLVVNELARVLKDRSILFFTLYENCSNRGAQYTSLGTWQTLLIGNGFQIIECEDITDEWRKHMAKKHQTRLKVRKKIEASMNQAGTLELAVSRAMLGAHGHDGFINLTKRYYIVALRSR